VTSHFSQPIFTQAKGVLIPIKFFLLKQVMSRLSKPFTENHPISRQFSPERVILA